MNRTFSKASGAAARGRHQSLTSLFGEPCLPVWPVWALPAAALSAVLSEPRLSVQGSGPCLAAPGN